MSRRTLNADAPDTFNLRLRINFAHLDKIPNAQEPGEAELVCGGTVAKRYPKVSNLELSASIVFWGLKNVIATKRTIFSKPVHFLGGGVKDEKIVKNNIWVLEILVHVRWQVHNTMTPLTQNSPEPIFLCLNQFSHTTYGLADPAFIVGNTNCNVQFISQ